MALIRIPRYINANGLNPFLQRLGASQHEPDLILEFSELQRVSPAGLAALTAWVKDRERRGWSTQAIGLEKCSITSYLARMNLLSLCNWVDSGSDSTRGSSNRFIPIEEISTQVEELGDSFAACIAPGGEEFGHPNAGLYDASWYLITEIANNVRQHSQGNGFLTAQATRTDGFVRIAIADCGKGVARSLREAGFAWSKHMSDSDCISKALEPRISSKGQPANEGVGLTLSARTTQLMGGWLMVASGSGVVICNPEGSRSSQEGLTFSFPGTLVTMAIPTRGAASFSEQLMKAKDTEGLLRSKPNPATFQA